MSTLLYYRKPSHRRYQPSSLYKLAFDSTCLSLWKLSSLPLLRAEAAVSCSKDSEDYEEYQKKTSEALENLEKDLKQSGQVPFRVRMTIMDVLSELDHDMGNFAFDVAVGLTNKTVENIKFCMEHVAVTENFTIDMTESICNIMRVSKLQLEFSVHGLVFLGVVKSKVCERLFGEQKTNLRKVLRLCARGKPTIDLAPNMFQWILSDRGILNVRQFWANKRRQDRKNGLKEKLRYAENLHYVATVGTVDSFKRYYGISCKKLEEYEIDEQIYQCAQFVFQVDAYSAEKIMFFKRNMSTQTWKRLLDSEFVNIFLTFLKSWRYRHLCMPLFNEVKDSMDKFTFHNLMKKFASMARDRYQYYGIITTFKEIWNEVPDGIKADRQIAYTIPELVLPRNNVDSSTMDQLLASLLFFLKNYTVEMQEDIIGRLIFDLVSTSNEKHIEICLKIAQDLGLESKPGKEYLPKERIKNILIDNAAVDYGKVTKYICNNKEEEIALKSDLIQDKNFIADLLANITDTLNPFFEWALEEESKIDTFKSNLLADDLIDDIYQRRLTQFASFSDANKIFNQEMLNLNQQKITEIQSRVKDYSEVLYFALHNYIGSENYDSDTFFTDLSFSKEEEVEFMRKFLYSSETKEAIYDMMLDLQDFDKSFLRSREGSRLMLRWHRFIRNMVRPYTDPIAYNEVLMNDRDKVISTLSEKVKRHPKFTTWCTSNSCTTNLHLRSMCFSLLFQNEDLEIKLQKYRKFQIVESGPFMFRIGMNMDGPFST